MASFSIRKLDDRVYRKLRIIAARHGVSMEEEARRILTNAVSAKVKVGQVFQKYFGKANGIDLTTSADKKPHQPMDFDE
ncbi:MAG: hypothetical protein K0U12_06915 [Gammaproteobacteria bacterium]|nr:hypothetical protein [Gammaproteobacteria bacterium]